MELLGQISTMKGSKMSRKLRCMMMLMVLGISGPAVDGRISSLPDCFYQHVCKCGYLSEYESCWKNLPPIAIDKSQLVLEKKFPELNLRDLSNFREVICKYPLNEVEPEFQATLDALTTYQKKIALDMEHMDDTIGIQTAKICAMPLISRCIEYSNQCIV